MYLKMKLAVISVLTAWLYGFASTTKGNLASIALALMSLEHVAHALTLMKK